MNKPEQLMSLNMPKLMTSRIERYLPTAFNDNLTLLEKVNKTILYLHEYSELSEQMLIKWNEVYSWVMNEGLDETISNRLIEMINDGRLAGIMENLLLTEYVKKDLLESELKEIRESLNLFIDSFRDEINNEFSDFKGEINDSVNNFKNEIEDDFNSLDSKIKDDFSELSDNVNNSLNDVFDYTIFPQSPKPEKSGVQTNSNKIIHKRTNDTIYVTQKTNKGYVQYRLEKNSGSSTEGRDYGKNHELIRLVRVRHVPQAYVYFDVSKPFIGGVEVSTSPSHFNSIESMIFPSNNIDGNLNHVSGSQGVGSYRFARGSKVTYRIDSKNSSKINLMLLCTSGSTDKLDIFINDQLVESFDPRQYRPSAGGESNGIRLLELDVPLNIRNNRLDIRLENNGSSGWAYICAINFFKLEDYNNQHINQYKAFGSSKRGWIENPGASDYAIRDSNGLLFGSYHGGEISTAEQIYFNHVGNYENSEYDYAYLPFSNIDNNSWSVQEDFNMIQRTSLADGKATMLINYSFNVDGTIDMDFSYNSELGFPISSFRTAITSTDVNFRHITYPVYNIFPETPTNDFLNVPTVEGRLIQVSTTSGLQLEHRFTKFNNKYSGRELFVADSPAYRKAYYGPLDGSQVLPLKSLSFSKSLDFTVR